MRFRPLLQIAPSVALLALANVATRLTPRPITRLAVPAASLTAIGLSRRRGVTWPELGLDPATRYRGLGYGSAAAAIVGAAVGVAASLPATRPLFLDERYRQDQGAAARYALLVIPLRTVLPEELAFRGVLLDAISRSYGPRAGAITSSVLFGLWHIPSSLDFGTDNRGIADRVHGVGRAQLLGVAGTVLGTAAADVIFVRLRRRSGSLLAPACLHWAFNGTGVLASAVLWRRLES